jgi:hypothetical protein
VTDLLPQPLPLPPQLGTRTANQADRGKKPPEQAKLITGLPNRTRDMDIHHVIDRMGLSGIATEAIDAAR